MQRWIRHTYVQRLKVKDDWLHSATPHAQVLVDFYDAEHNTSRGIWAVYPAFSGRSAVGQSVLLTQSRILRSVKFRLTPYQGSPKGTLVAALYNATGTYGSTAKPTGSALAISDPVSIESITSSAFYEFTFPYGQRYKMRKDKCYCIVVQTHSAVVLNVDNYPAVQTRDYGTHLGNACQFINGVWASIPTEDALFYLYGA